MAPDADKVRQRKFVSTGGVGTAEQDGSTQVANGERLIADINNLKSNEVAIDGVIYDLNTFNHPGGETIKVFGGNDVTVQYRMIHPYHTAKHLEKMQRVGKIADYTCE